MGSGGAKYDENGGGANHLCMEYSTALSYDSTLPSNTHIYGAQYSYPVEGTGMHVIPCAVCYAQSKDTVLMIPGKASCPSTWTRKYYGYLMAEASYYSARHRSMYECVDAKQQSLAKSSWGSVLYHVKTDCSTGLYCQSANANKQLNCVVCTK